MNTNFLGLLELRREKITLDSEDAPTKEAQWEWGHLVHVPLGVALILDVDIALPQWAIREADAVLLTDRGCHLVFLERKPSVFLTSRADARYTGMVGARQGYQMRAFSKRPPYLRRTLLGLTPAGCQFAEAWNRVAAQAGEFDPDRADPPQVFAEPARVPSPEDIDRLLGAAR